ncbi:hypothetical protein K474DRAFT_1499959 [Panus rudis PR-1116 ss-1]|nr:hypothetical protein K474DRAFT_1499959 [Panus rudis PR-1116 ss-1]
MNNLLRTLTELQSKSDKPQPDLKLLLTTVKEARRQALENKATDAFYDSLEGLLHDLRTVTVDNHDAEPFLKAVSKTDVPDYYDVITTPMDLGTMLRKVKHKNYKSKREFKDDLDLIWSNCYTYNAAENHPLRQCAARLKAKADKLLEYITDRKDRENPPIPGDIVSRGVTPKVNGASPNGIGRARPVPFTRSPSPNKPATASGKPMVRRNIPFPEETAILRTATGMKTFRDIDLELDARLAEIEAHGTDAPSNGVENKLRVISGHVIPPANDETSMAEDGEVGDKRKLNGFPEQRPRKRARMVEMDPVSLWWNAMCSDEMIGNGLPVLQYSASHKLPGEPPLPSSSTSEAPPPSSTKPPLKKKRRKPPVANQRTLLYHMNNNIRTLRKVRTTHAMLTAVKESANEEGGGNGQPISMPPPAEEVEEVLDERPWRPPGSGLEIGERNADDCLHWVGTKILEHAGFQGSSKAALDVLAGVASDYLLNVGRTIHYLSEKYARKMTPEEIILHTLFESGTTRISELERYIRDDVLRYGNRLNDLDKKLTAAYSEATAGDMWDDDALFKMEDEEEDAEFVMGNFAESFGEDFLGLRELGIAHEFGLSTLSVPKKLLRGKNKAQPGPSAAKPNEPPPPFPPPPPFIPLDSKNVDSQIGLLKPYYQQRISSLAQPAPVQPIAPPPPPPAIGILPPPLPGPMLSGPSYPNQPPQAMPPPFAPAPAPVPAPTQSPPPVILPDDPPPPAHTKIGPIGQIVKTNPSAATSKKKSTKPKAEPMVNVGSMDGTGAGVPDGMQRAETPSSNVFTFYTPSAENTPKKPKPGGGANGNAAKKKPKDPLPPPVFASA